MYFFTPHPLYSYLPTYLPALLPTPYLYSLPSHLYSWASMSWSLVLVATSHSTSPQAYMSILGRKACR